MFTWICPQCGREVPPAYTECPDCANKAAAPPPQPPAQAPAPPPVYAAPPTPPQQQVPPPYQAPPQAPPAYQQPTYSQQPAHAAQPVMQYPPPEAPRSNVLHTVLMTVLFAFAFLGLGLGLYWLIDRRGPSTPTAAVESPAAKPGARLNPYQKYIEIAGVRFTTDAKKKPVVKFIVINHSPADIEGLAANVTIWGRTQKSEEEAAGSFVFKTNLGPWESKDLTAPLDTKKQMVELPDWQNTSTDIQVTAPGA
jgi:hypothetical protein